MCKGCGLCCWILIVCSMHCHAQRDDGNVIVVTVDGFRWQELFQGADSLLIYNSQVTTDPGVVSSYWHSKTEMRRMKLMPFFWNEIAGKGQLLGNRNFGNLVSCENPYWFSYPGYNEMFTGFIDRKVKSNEAIDNRNETVFEFISKAPGFEGRVAAFATWGVFPAIFHEGRSGIQVNAGSDSARGEISEREQLLNELQLLIPNPVTERHDVFTTFFAIEYMKREHPRVVFIGLDETDSYAHDGQYDEYLKAASRSDQLIARLWKFIQSDEFYTDKTTILITADHGRGRGYRYAKMNWRSHGRLAPGSDEIWIAAIGPDVPAHGEVRTSGKTALGQIASTVAAMLNINYVNRERVALPVSSFLRSPHYISAPASEYVLPLDDNRR